VRPLRIFFLFFLALLSPQFLETGKVEAQQPSNDQVAPPPHVKQIHLKHVLVIGQTKDFEHDSVSAAMTAIYTMGKESGLWDTMLRTDTELLTKTPTTRVFTVPTMTFQWAEDPDNRKMYFEAIKWSLGMTKGSTASHPKQLPPSQAIEVRPGCDSATGES
jgi:hypothetical protein